MRIRKIYLLFLIIFVSVLVFLPSCESGKEDSELSHSHSYSVTEDGVLLCSCGSMITEPYIAMMQGDTVTSFHYISEGSSGEFGLEVNGDFLALSDSDEPGDIVLRTSSSQSISVSASCNIVHYGTAYKVTVNNNTENVYTEKGRINSCIIVESGSVSLEKSVSEVVIRQKNSAAVTLWLGGRVTVDKIQVDDSAAPDIRITGASDAKVKSLTTVVPVSVGVDMENIGIKSENVSISVSGDAHVYEITSDVVFESGKPLELKINDDAVVDGIFNVDSHSVDIVQYRTEQLHVHTWGSGFFVGESSAENRNSIEFTCDVCHQTTRKTTDSSGSGDYGFVVTEETDKRIKAVISVTQVTEDTFLVSLTSSNGNTDYLSSVYRWYFDYTTPVKNESGVKKSTYECALCDDKVHTVSCTYFNDYGSGSISVHVKKTDL